MLAGLMYKKGKHKMSRRGKKWKPHIDFNGTIGTYYGMGFFFNKIIFTVSNDTLLIKWYMGNKFIQKTSVTEFRKYTAIEIINRYERHTENHFCDGIYDIWKFYDLPFGYVPRILRDISK